MEESKFFDGIISMKRLQLKAKLIEDCSVIYEGLAKNREVLPKKFRKRSEMSVLRDFLKGIKIINKKCAVFVELPKIESCGNGLTREIDPKTKQPLNNEIQVASIDYQIETDMKKVIECSKESNDTF